MSAHQGAVGLRDRIADEMKTAPKSALPLLMTLLERAKAVVDELEAVSPLVEFVGRDGNSYRVNTTHQRPYLCHGTVTPEMIGSGLVKIFDSQPRAGDFRQHQWPVLRESDKAKPENPLGACLRGVFVYGYRDLPMLGGDIHVCLNDDPEPVVALSVVDAFLSDPTTACFNIASPMVLVGADRLHVYWRDPLLPVRGLVDFELVCGVELLHLGAATNGAVDFDLASLVKRLVPYQQDKFP